MPFASESQRRLLHAKHPAIAARWEKHTPRNKKLPERVKASRLLLKIAAGMTGSGLASSPLSSSVWQNLGKPIAKPNSQIQPGTKSPSTQPLSTLAATPLSGLQGPMKGKAIPTIAGLQAKKASSRRALGQLFKLGSRLTKRAQEGEQPAPTQSPLAQTGLAGLAGASPAVLAALAAALAGPAVGTIGGFAGAPKGYGLEGAGRGFGVGGVTGAGALGGAVLGGLAGTGVGAAAGSPGVAAGLGLLGAGLGGVGGGYVGHRLGRGAAGAPYWTRDELMEQRRKVDAAL